MEKPARPRKKVVKMRGGMSRDGVHHLDEGAGRSERDREGT